MAATFKRNDGVPCRMCGASFAPPHDNKWGVCWNCFRLLEYRATGDAEFIAYIARRLELDASRIRRAGIVGRCQALSLGSGQSGYQCGRGAVEWRDGQKVCRVHAKRAVNPVYADQATQNHYDIFAELLACVAKHDPAFKAAVERSLELVEPVA